MSTKPLPSQGELCRLFRYEDGNLYWRDREDARPQWNARYAGKRAGNKQPDGRWFVSIQGRGLFKVHRVVWKMHHGDEPGLIDHIDRDTSNNRIENLRRATRSQNLGNTKTRAKSGRKGVHLHQASGLWMATICGRHLGYYRSIDDAAAAYASAADAHFGEFARY